MKEKEMKKLRMVTTPQQHKSTKLRWCKTKPIATKPHFINKVNYKRDKAKQKKETYLWEWWMYKSLKMK